MSSDVSYSEASAPACRQAGIKPSTNFYKALSLSLKGYCKSTPMSHLERFIKLVLGKFVRHRTLADSLILKILPQLLLHLNPI